MENVTPEEEDFPGRLLHQAALWDNAELLEDLLRDEQIAHINSQDSWGRTPLHAAACTDESRCLAVLLHAGGDANISCGPRGENRTPLHVSSEHGFLGNVRLLLSHGADLVARDCNGLTPLDLAEKCDHAECMYLLKETADAKEVAHQKWHATLREACATGEATQVKNLLEPPNASSPAEAELVVNMAPSGSNTLLFIACEVGRPDVVKALLDHGADGRVHPVTKYSPLYIACYHGRKDIVQLLLKRFPELIQQPTVEKWLPFHACCINGHVNIMELLLKFTYPVHLLNKYRDLTQEWEYDFAFDINSKDVRSQSILYVASLLGNCQIVDLLVKFRVKASRVIKEAESNDCETTTISAPTTPLAELVSPSRRRISDGIQSIMDRLSLSRRGDPSPANAAECQLSPVHLNDLCNNNSETALHAAVRGKHSLIATALLKAGADPNVQCRVPDQANEGDPGGGGLSTSGSVASSSSTALFQACKNRDLTTVDLLLRHGARDDGCKALSIVQRDDILIAKLLAIKAFPDPEYKLNRTALTQQGLSTFSQLAGLAGTLTYSSLFPNTPVMINWHNQQCNLNQIRKQWLIDAALSVNPKLKLNPRHQEHVLLSITRIDISKNSLTWLPSIIFQLHSLKYLNVAQNKIEKLPPAREELVPLANKKGNPKLSSVKVYSAPVLEEMYLQDNRLESICPEVFQLPSLITLDLSNNKLQHLPYQMWKSPKLKELNVAFNLLRELPIQCGPISQPSTPVHPPFSGIEPPGFDTTSVSEPPLCTTTEEIEEHLTDASTLQQALMKSKPVQQLELIHHNLWSRHVEVTEQILHASDDSTSENCSQLSSLNLAHNLFTSVPAALPCLAVNLTRLNLSYNSLRSMSYITSYPLSLKQLDLSHNQLVCWPSLPQLEALAGVDASTTACYAPLNTSASSTDLQQIPGRMPTTPVAGGGQGGGNNGKRSLRSALLHYVCTHRRHLRLDNLRTLIVADNQLARIQLSTDDDGGGSSISEEDDSDWDVLGPPGGFAKSRLMFPNLSMLDISNNLLREIPHNIHELANLSVLNISGNIDIWELPPQMGLLSRLWNLNTRGCSLQEPLKSMIDSKKYKTMDVVGYLKSILEDARPYARIKLMIVGIQGIGKTSLLEQLRQEGLSIHKKKPTEHWAKRMGNRNMTTKTAKGTNISTVGVDIGEWLYEKRPNVRGHSSFGPILFRTWDFGGQREYYATHQYFLSKRSLYLVVWKLSDGQRGLNEILQWLVNIQARAPNSPVLIVGTHQDLVPNDQGTQDWQQIIREKFINIVDAEKCGLPRVLDSIEVSCKTRHNIKLLCNTIYDTVLSLRTPGSKQLLLEQRVPASYLALEDVVIHVAAERRVANVDPVLSADQFRAVVTAEMQYRFQRSFRDQSELHQASLFLHENGVMLHYDDATLKDLYFLDPQWLCDMLAHVVTIREINPFARSGVMKLEDLKHLFKSSCLGPVDARSYIVNLLNKFEVALTWDSRTLLIPSLLPTEETMRSALAQFFLPSGPASPVASGVVRVKIPVRSRGWAVRTKKISLTENPDFHLARPGGSPVIVPDITSSSASSSSSSSVNLQYQMSQRNDPELSIRRLLLMSYFPCGFWSRLITRILADDSVVDIVRSFFIMPREIGQDPRLSELVSGRAEWLLWQTGMELRYADTTLFRLKEVLPLRNNPSDYRSNKFLLKQEGQWTDVDLVNSSILEIYFPVDTIVIKRPILDDSLGSSGEAIGYQAVVLEPSPEATAQLLALAVDHVDILLEDWYPTLGTRFVHTSEGKFLVTRLIPCPRCLAALQQDPLEISGRSNDIYIVGGPHPRHLAEELERIELSGTPRVRQSQESATSDGDSGVGPESSGSSRKQSMEGHPSHNTVHVPTNSTSVEPMVFTWIVEECILAANHRQTVQCPQHGELSLAQVAPDTMFLDLGERHLIRPDNIRRGCLLGRGAFGFVFRATCKLRGTGAWVDVALKMLEPVQPGPNARQSAIIAYKAAQGKWDRDPLQYATKAYCTARQELNILLSLRHPNIVPLVGVCTRPLALVLDLAPQGALDAALRHYRRSGSRLSPFTLQAIILQVAKALEYLHQQHIIYRDLKSENVLVWTLPPPCADQEISPTPNVHIKLADYGISRLTLPSGTKGFGGTEGFMAPEIMRYNGEEEYTEKVDCFSFGMFVYELLTLHQPFEGHESVKETILEGGRPPLSPRETTYPSHILELMVLCWAQSPRDRPSASQIVSIASAPEFTHLADAVSLEHHAKVIDTAAIPLAQLAEDKTSSSAGAQIWLASDNSRADLLLASSQGTWLQYCTLPLVHKPTAACAVDEKQVWLGDCRGQIHAFTGAECTKMFSYALEPEAFDKSNLENEEDESFAVTCMVPLGQGEARRVAVALGNGRLFLVRSDRPPPTTSMAEGSFVMTELGSTQTIHSMAAFDNQMTGMCELWCGELSGTISIFTIRDQVVSGHQVVNHFEPIIENVCVMNLVTSPPEQPLALWSYVYPGCVVYQWEPESRTIVNKLDCSKLVPCSESLKSISIEEHLSPGRCQVTSVAVCGQELYVGTTWGCVIVAERASMRPITVFRPYEEHVRALVPLGSDLVASVGRGYRSLIARYTDTVATPTPSSPSSSLHPYYVAGSAASVYALLWRAGHWAAV